ncbi:MAG: cupin domain-containing protein [Solirubrobacteraceae bacterium]
MTDVQHEQVAERIRVGQEEIAVRVTTADSGGRLLAVDVTMPPGGGPPALHRHDPVEVYRVLEGEFTFYFGDGDAIERVVAPVGAAVHVAGGREHTIRNESDRAARGFVTFTDGAAQMEGFLRAAGALAERGALALEDVLAVAGYRSPGRCRPDARAEPHRRADVRRRSRGAGR